jgi:hypothetical protein
VIDPAFVYRYTQDVDPFSQTVSAVAAPRFGPWSGVGGDGVQQPVLMASRCRVGVCQVDFDGVWHSSADQGAGIGYLPVADRKCP